jgi:hypothetical protein
MLAVRRGKYLALLAMASSNWIVNVGGFQEWIVVRGGWFIGCRGLRTRQGGAYLNSDPNTHLKSNNIYSFDLQ